MKRVVCTVLVFAAVTVAGCSRESAGLEVEPGADVVLERQDGVQVVGRLIEVRPEHVVVESAGGQKTTVARRDISALRAEPVRKADRGAEGGADVSAPPGARNAGAPADGPIGREPAAGPIASAPDPRPELRELTIPAGTTLRVELTTAVGSATSRLEDPVRGRLRSVVRVGGVDALPAGSTVRGHVTAAERSGRVKGRARVAFRFTSIDIPGDAERLPIRTTAVSRLAPATKKQDAAKIGGGAVGGAIVGGIIGGGDGAAKGAAIGGAAGTGVVVSTRGREVQLGPGEAVTVTLSEPLLVRVAVPRG